MEHFGVTQQSPTALRIEGFPDAVKVVRLDGARARRLADLALHKADLDFAHACLREINDVPPEPSVAREALWRSAILHVFKCFGDSTARFQLAPRKVLKHEPPEALVVFEYFKNLRNKHLVHDENSYAQGAPGAVLNGGDKPHKVEKIVCSVTRSQTLQQESYANLVLLVNRTQAWVIAEFDTLCIQLTDELEKKSYAELLAKEPLSFRPSSVHDVGTTRNAP